MAKRSTSRSKKRATERRRQRARRQRVGWIIGGAIGLALIIGIIYLVTASPRATSNLPGEHVPSLGNDHIAPPETFDGYNSTPPTSGPHYGNLAPWGVSEEPISNELQIHNLEDGGVGVQYNCPDGCPQLVEQLEAIVSQYPEGVFMAPYSDMEHRIALTAWGRIDTLDEFDEQRVQAFVRAYRGVDHHVR